MSVKYEGIIPPIVTPFTASGEIDEEKIRREMEICLDAGADGISVGGSTGEGPTLRDEELTQLIKIAREYVKEGSDKTVVCGIMRTCTRDAVRAGKTAKEAGADAIMVTPTAYNVLVPNAEGMFDFYNTISEEVQLPTIIYNVIPQNTIYVMLLPTIVQGAMGLVSGGAQIFGHEIRAIFDAFEAGENEKAKETFEPLYRFCKSTGQNGRILPNSIMRPAIEAVSGIKLGNARLPLAPPTDEEMKVNTVLDGVCRACWYCRTCQQ